MPLRCLNRNEYTSISLHLWVVRSWCLHVEKRACKYYAVVQGSLAGVFRY